MITSVKPPSGFSQQDSTVNAKIDTTHSIKKATIYSAILPGLGQAYNKKSWKIPIVYAGLGTIGYFIHFNNTEYKRYKTDLLAVTDDNPATIYDGPASSSQLKQYMNSYRRDRDFTIILFAAFYVLNIIDAHVDSHFVNFDVSDDLSMRINPVLIPFNNYTTLGLSCRLSF
ncbi:DUF5683 domain-containing protein [Bacteroidota bacterium]